MSYYRPDNERFSIEEYGFSMDDVEDDLLLFDIPADITVHIDNNPIPGKTFDYLNPLYYRPNLTEPIRFYRQGTTEAITEFRCFLIKTDMEHVRSIVNIYPMFYPPFYTFIYRENRVMYSNKGAQLSKVLQDINVMSGWTQPMSEHILAFLTGIDLMD